jgi:hypothetical protein
MHFWPKRKDDPPPPIYVGSHEDHLRRIRPIHFSADDEGHTREDRARERADRRADRFPWGGWYEREDR